MAVTVVLVGVLQGHSPHMIHEDEIGTDILDLDKNRRVVLLPGWCSSGGVIFLPNLEVNISLQFVL